MKKHLLKALLLIGMFCVGMFVMSAETVTNERQSFKQHQELSIDCVSVDLQVVDLIAFGRTTEMLPINEAEVEISYGDLIKNDIDILAINYKIEQMYNVRTTMNDVIDINVQKQKFNRDILNQDIEHRIRGIPTTNKTI